MAATDTGAGTSAGHGADPGRPGPPLPGPGPGPGEVRAGGPRRAAWLGVPGRRERRASRGYSWFVNLAKVLLALGAVAGVIALVTWPGLVAPPDGQPRLDQATATLVRAIQTGVDGKGRPYSIVAQRAWRPANEEQAVDMIQPFAEITTGNGAWISLSAERGRYNEATGKLVLLGKVRINQDQGYEFNTEEVHYLMGESLGWGDRPVTAQGSFGVVDASGFRLFEGGRTVVFVGPARAVLSPGAGTGRGPE